MQARIIGALVLRDTHTRYGRSFIGLVAIIGQPLLHLLFLMGIYLVTGRLTQFGTSVPVFLGTGVLPFILFFYPGRWIMFALAQNQALLFFPIVKPLDVIVARGVLDVVTAFWVTAIFFAILYLFGVEVLPLDASEAMAAVLATIYLGFSLGFLGAVMYKLMRVWLGVQLILLIAMYSTSGVFFIPSTLPEKIRDILWFNPLLHSVEWLRSAYFEGYGVGMLNKTYLLSYATILLLLALVVERATRGRLMQ